jgi:predicted nicotinamide N-methyase
MRAVSASDPAPRDSTAPCRELLRIPIAGRDWLIERLADLETLWAGMDEHQFGADERLPYWAEVWPASILLAGQILRSGPRLAGRTVLDLGCGLGLTAVAASSVGARVLGLDYEAQALRFARGNAARNNAPQPLWTLMDWRRPGLKPGVFSFVLAGDIFYEQRFFDPLRRLLGEALAGDGVAWLAEPERSVSAPSRLADLGFAVRLLCTEKVAAVPAGNVVTVNLFELAR